MTMARRCRSHGKPTSVAAVLLRVLALALFSAPALACSGKTVINQNFNQHGGGYKQLSLNALMADFPRGGKRAGAGGGATHTAGFTYAKGLERAEVGNGHLRVKHPQGAAPSTAAAFCPLPSFSCENPARNQGARTCSAQARCGCLCCPGLLQAHGATCIEAGHVKKCQGGGWLGRTAAPVSVTHAQLCSQHDACVRFTSQYFLCFWATCSTLSCVLCQIATPNQRLQVIDTFFRLRLRR